MSCESRQPWLRFEARTAADVILLLAVVLVGAILRLHHLDHFSLWDDEARTFLVCALRDPVELVRAIPWFVPAQPPLDLLVRWAAMRLASPSTYVFTLVSALFSTAGLFCWHALFARLLDRRTALTAVAILSFHPTLVLYAQTGRNYAVMDVVVPGASLLLLAAWHRGGWLRWSAYGLALAAAFHTHLLLVSLGAAHGAVLAVLHLGAPRLASRPDLRRRLLAFGGALALAGVLCLPWLYYTWFRMPEKPRFVGAGIRYHTLLQVLESSLPATGWGLAAAGLLAIVGCVQFTWSWPRRGTALLAAFAVGYAVSFAITYRNFFHFRYVYFLVPVVTACVALGVGWLADLLGRGASRLRASRRAARSFAPGAAALGVVALAAGAWPQLAAQYTHGIEYDGDWRSAVRFVEATASPADLIVVPHRYHANHAVYATLDFAGATDPDNPVSWQTEPWILRARGVRYSVLPADAEAAQRLAAEVGRVFVIGRPDDSTLGLRWLLDSPTLRPLREHRELSETRFRGLLVAELAPE